MHGIKTTAAVHSPSAPAVWCSRNLMFTNGIQVAIVSVFPKGRFTQHVIIMSLENGKGKRTTVTTKYSNFSTHNQLLIYSVSMVAQTYGHL